VETDFPEYFQLQTRHFGADIILGILNRVATVTGGWATRGPDPESERMIDAQS